MCRTRLQGWLREQQAATGGNATLLSKRPRQARGLDQGCAEGQLEAGAKRRHLQSSLRVVGFQDGAMQRRQKYKAPTIDCECGAEQICWFV